MGLETDLAGALRTVARSLSVRELRKQKVDSVRVIDREQFLAVLEQVEASGRARGEDADRKRMERLIQETERLGREKKELEHAKGLAEAERSRVQADLDEVANELGRELGKKLAPGEVKGLLEELARLRDEREKAKKTLDHLQKQSQARLAQELTKSQTLKQGLEQSTLEGERLKAERDQLEEEQEAFRQELEQFRCERDRFREERDRFRAECDRFRKERDDYLLSCTNLGQERDALRKRLAEAEVFRATLGELERELEEKDAQNAALTAEVEGARAELEATRAALEAKEGELEDAQARLDGARSLGGRTGATGERVRGTGAARNAALGFGFGFPGGGSKSF